MGLTSARGSTRVTDSDASIPNPKVRNKRSRRKAREPLDVRLTVKVKFGDQSDETVTIMDDRAVPMVDSVFYYRDQIFKGISTMLFKAIALQPKLAREVLPLVGQIRPGRKGKA
jgi:hypothetical protein